MKELWQKMMEREQLMSQLPSTVIYRKIRSKHSIYLAYNRIQKETLLIIELSIEDSKRGQLPNCKGFSCDWGINGASRALILSCSDKQNMDFFLKVIDDVRKYIENYSDENEMVNRAISRLKMWQNFFQEHGNQSMSVEKQEGLYGELKIMEELSSETNLAHIVSSWVGPYGETHDYCFSEVYIEAKCTSRKNPPAIKINGLTQLQVPDGPSLYLAVLNVSISNHLGETVNEVVNRISLKLRETPDVLGNFHTKLMKYGYPLSGIEEPSCFIVGDKEIQWYKVVNEFPKAYGDGPVFNCTYCLPLSALESFACSQEEILELLPRDSIVS
ncbi:hypothetical protein COI88_27945 [Bacillus cereus]|nr:hypothetical protein COI88_27945 [Bacillus cereus]